MMTRWRDRSGLRYPWPGVFGVGREVWTTFGALGREVVLPAWTDSVVIGLQHVPADELDELIDVLTEARDLLASRPPIRPRPLGPGPLHFRVWRETDGRPSAAAYAAWVVREELNPWGVWPDVLPSRTRELESGAAVRARRAAAAPPGTTVAIGTRRWLLDGFVPVPGVTYEFQGWLFKGNDPAFGIVNGRRYPLTEL